MGSLNHPKYYDTADLDLVTESLHDVWEVVKGQNSLVLTQNEEALRTTIIQSLLDLVAEGITDKQMLKSEALKRLPLS